MRQVGKQSKGKKGDKHGRDSKDMVTENTFKAAPKGK